MALDSTARRRPKANGKRIPISTYFEPADYDRLVDLADKNERPLAAELRLAVRAHLDRQGTA